jgi:hypothetical protein
MRYLACFLLALVGCSRPTAPFASIAPASEERVAGAIRPPDDPEARADRRMQLRQDVDTIQADCDRQAGGDWQRWIGQTGRYRNVLNGRIATSTGGTSPADRHLVGLQRPLFQANPVASLAHIVDPEFWNAFRRARLVAAASSWLQQRGVDLIFVSVPSMPTVYIEDFLADTPPDGIIAPHIRQTFLELLQADVETVDTFRIMRAARDGEFQYLPADHHWNQTGMRGAVREVARRLMRYPFGRTAKNEMPITKSEPVPYALPPGEHGKAWRPFGGIALTDSEWHAAVSTMPRTMDNITSPDGSAVADDPRSPVMLIGNSSAVYFREMLVREANLPVRTRWGNGNTTDAFSGFLREPETLDGVRVLVWVAADELLYYFRPLPAPIMDALHTSENRIGSGAAGP